MMKYVTEAGDLPSKNKLALCRGGITVGKRHPLLQPLMGKWEGEDKTKGPANLAYSFQDACKAKRE